MSTHRRNLSPLPATSVQSGWTWRRADGVRVVASSVGPDVWVPTTGTTNRKCTECGGRAVYVTIDESKAPDVTMTPVCLLHAERFQRALNRLREAI